MYTPTTEQRIAADPSHHVWVTAHAGTGKTRILTDRVLRLILEGTAPEQILCLTFTKAAAGEMKERITHNLLRFATLDIATLRDELAILLDTATVSEQDARLAQERAIMLIDHANLLNIRTIHSLCQTILKQFPLEFDAIPSNFTVMDDQQQATLLNQAKTSLLEGLSHSLDNDQKLHSAVTYLVTHRKESTFFNALDLLIAHREKFQSLLDVHQSVDNYLTFLREKLALGHDPSIEGSLDAFFTGDTVPLDCLNAIVRFLQSETKLGKTDSHFLHSLTHALSLQYNKERFLAYKSAFFTQKNTPKKSLLTKKIQQLIGEDHYLTLQHFQHALLELHHHCLNIELYEQTAALLTVGDALSSLYSRLKLDTNTLDNHDLILHTAELLNQADHSPWILFKLDQKISHLLVDEAQDTSPLQWHIIQTLCQDFFSGEGANSDRSLFVVGDEKQSIYSFQGADPIIFSAYKNLFERQAQAAQSDWHNVVMSTSFRSAPAILTLVDHIANLSNIKPAISLQDQHINHQIHRDTHYSKVTLAPFFTPEDEPTQQKDDTQLWTVQRDYETSTQLHKVAAQQLADQIHQWFIHQKYMPNHQRTIEPGDIMILVQTRSAFVNYLTQALTEYNLPVAGADRISLTSHIVIDDLLALAQFSITPYDDLNLAALLKSPLISMSENTLYELAVSRGDASLWQALLAQPQNFTKEIKFLTQTIELQKISTPKEFFIELLESYNIRTLLLQSMGPTIQDILHEFLFLLQQYSQDYHHDMQHFLQWMSKQSIQIKRDSSQSNNDIRIMTIHGSKGLQSPIVILPDSYQRSAAKPDPLLWQNEYDSPPLCLWATGHASTPIVEDIRRHISDSLHEEKLRLLYVALTRAEDELYISGYGKSYKASDTQWYTLLHEALRQLPHQDNEDGSLSYEPIPYDNTPDIPQHYNAESPPSLPDFPERYHTTYPLPTHDRDWQHSHQPLKTPEIERGIFIHRLLELLPAISDHKRSEFTAAHIKRFTHDPALREELHHHIEQLLRNESLAFIFNHDQAFSELAISTPDGRYILDRLIITQDTAYIIDYKTTRAGHTLDRPIPAPYQKQLIQYCQLIEPHYPDLHIKAAILWTQSLTLQFIDAPMDKIH